eukprot:s97_g7.t2
MGRLNPTWTAYACLRQSSGQDGAVTERGKSFGLAAGCAGGVTVGLAAVDVNVLPGIQLPTTLTGPHWPYWRLAAAIAYRDIEESLLSSAHHTCCKEWQFCQTLALQREVPAVDRQRKVSGELRYDSWSRGRPLYPLKEWEPCSSPSTSALPQPELFWNARLRTNERLELSACGAACHSLPFEPVQTPLEHPLEVDKVNTDWDAHVQFTVKHEQVHEKAGLASPMLIVSSVRPTQPPQLAEQVDPVPPSPATKIACDVTVDESQKSDCDSSPRSPFTGIQDPGGALQRMISPSSQTMAARASVMGRPPTEEESCLSRLAMWLRFNLDYCTGFVLAINLIFMCVELELQGRAAGHLASESSLSLLSLQELNVPLRIVDIAFDTVFLIELLLRMGLDGWALFRKFSGWYDVSLVAVGIADMAVFVAAGADAEVAAVHVIRAASTLRAIRLLRIFRLFQGLRLLIRACHAFLPTLGWSMVLLGLCMVMSGVLVGSLLQIFLWNDMLALEHKIWIFDRYGTAYRSIYTLFEA